MSSMTVRDLIDGLIKFKWDTPVMIGSDYSIENITSLREVNAFEIADKSRTWISTNPAAQTVYSDCKVTPIKILVIG